MQASPGKARLGRIVALAASPVSGAKYAGHLKLSSADTVTFKVSASGKKVIGVKVMPEIPNRCGSGGGTLPSQVSKPAKIENGKFSAVVEEKLSNGAVSGTATVTGKFLRGGKEMGVVENPLPGAKECAGNFSYTATASKK